ncbi:Capreomycidine synthase [Fundidesulfovibrio magnetotacticus]|uniref:Capreomycidine synthase n=1 Tax=Fundidesulfovibrio magnetotacticus TaxID=2730080 RepID=A0A6V8LVG6_9BACT|nr:Capreomycidine synthase [Fundidesulfovibrio magnetotacticus]
MNLPPFLLERYFAEHEFSAPHLLCVSDCEALTVGQLLDLEPGGREALERLPLGYSESAGHPELRALIAGLHGGLAPEDVLVHVGAQEAVFTFATALLEPGDEVVVHVPCYQSLFQVAASRGCRVIPWTAREENGWLPDPDELESLMGERTRAVVLNFPHNPTGARLDRSGLERVARIAARRGCWLFSDEVYRFLEYGPGETAQPACELYERAVSLGVMSKSFGLAGLRVGWAACRDRGLLAEMARVKDYTTICGTAPGEFLACLALRRREQVLERTRAVTLGNLELLRGFMERRKDLLHWVEPSGGPIAFPRLASGADARPFCEAALAATGVLLLPGALYGEAWKAHFRVGFGRAGFAAGLAALEPWLASGRACAS